MLLVVIHGRRRYYCIIGSAQPLDAHKFFFDTAELFVAGCRLFPDLSRDSAESKSFPVAETCHELGSEPARMSTGGQHKTGRRGLRCCSYRIVELSLIRCIL